MYAAANRRGEIGDAIDLERRRRDRSRARAGPGSGGLVGRVADLERRRRERRSSAAGSPARGAGRGGPPARRTAPGRRSAPRRVNDGRSTSAPSSRTTDVPVLASNRVTTMPGDVHIGWVMYEYIRIASTRVEPVGAEPGEDVGQAGRHAAAGDDPAAGRHGGVVARELLERLRVVRAEVDEVDAGRDRGIGDRHVLAHVGGVEDDLGAGQGRRERGGIVDVHAGRPVRARPARRSRACAASGRMSPIVTSWSVRATRSATAADPISPDPPRTRIAAHRGGEARPDPIPRHRSIRAIDLVGRIVDVGDLDAQVAARPARRLQRDDRAVIGDPRVDRGAGRQAEKPLASFVPSIR